MSSPIRSRKHAINPYAIALAALALPAAVVPAHAFIAPTTEAVADAAENDKDKDHRRDHEHERGTEVTIKGERHQPLKVDVSANRKATASLLDTPQTVQIITDEIINQQGATNLTEALRNTPGVGTFFLGENGTTSTGDAIYMRGSDTSGSIFVDGVRDVASVSRDTFNVEQVEVLKGAAGSDIGRGSATGAINLVTKRPFLNNGYKATFGIGDGDYLRATADLNWKLGDRTAFRLNLLDQDAGVAGRDQVKNKRWSIAPTLAFGLKTPTRFYLSAAHTEQDNTPDGGVMTIGLPGYSSPDAARPYLATAPRVKSTNWYGNKDDHDNITTDTLSLIVEHDFSDTLSIVNVSRFNQTDQEYQLTSFLASSGNLVTQASGAIATDPSTWFLSTRSITNKNATNKILTNQTNLRVRVNTGPFEHQISTGLEFISEDAISRLYTGTGAYPKLSVYNPDPNATGYTRALNGGYTQMETTTTGLYFNDTVRFSEQWQATGGVRLDKYKTDYHSLTAANVMTTAKGDEQIVSGKLGVVYKPSRNASLYASWAVTKQPPSGVVQTGANAPDSPPQEAKTSEAGAKWNLLHNRLALTGAIYKTSYSDSLAQDSDGSYYHTGEKSVRGVELNAVGQITKLWNISAGYTTMKTKTILAPVAADGSQALTYNPTDSFTLWTTYVLPKGFTIGGGANYNGEMLRGTDGAIGTPKVIKSYIIYNGLVKYRVNEKIELQLNGYNLFDHQYVAAINKSGYRYTPGIPQSFRLSANVSF